MLNKTVLFIASFILGAMVTNAYAGSGVGSVEELRTKYEQLRNVQTLESGARIADAYDENYVYVATAADRVGRTDREILELENNNTALYQFGHYKLGGEYVARDLPTSNGGGVAHATRSHQAGHSDISAIHARNVARIQARQRAVAAERAEQRVAEEAARAEQDTRLVPLTAENVSAFYSRIVDSNIAEGNVVVEDDGSVWIQ